MHMMESGPSGGIIAIDKEASLRSVHSSLVENIWLLQYIPSWAS